MFHLNKSSFRKNFSSYLDTLYEALGDRDPLVVMNAIEGLNEILADKGGIEVTR